MTRAGGSGVRARLAADASGSRRLARLVDRPPPDGELFLRWSKGPQVDLPDGGSSRDTLTGIALPGLSANPLAVGLGAGSWGPLDRVGSRR